MVRTKESTNESRVSRCIWTNESAPLCLIFSVTKYGLKLYPCQAWPGNPALGSQFFCFSSSFSSWNKTGTHYDHLTKTAPALASVMWQCSARLWADNKKRKLLLIIALSVLRYQEVSSWLAVIIIYSEPSQQIVKFLDLTEKIVQLRSTKAK